LKIGQYLTKLRRTKQNCAIFGPPCTSRSRSQPCSHQQILPAMHNSQFQSSGHRDSSITIHQAVELVQELGRRATDIDGDCSETTYAYLFQPLSVHGFAKEELMRSRFRTRSQPANLLPTCYKLFFASMFADQKNNINNNNTGR